MPTTIKDIARQAGVAHTTVSRALRDSPLISAKTTERIKTIAEELGYHPSVAARSLKTNRSQALGVIVSNIADPFFSEILQGIDDIAQERGYSLFIAAAQHDWAREKGIVHTMREHRVDGVIICSTPFSTFQSQQLVESGIPIVVVNNQAVEEYRYSIYHDDVDGGRQITRHLIDLGHTSIAFLGNSFSQRATTARLSGFKQEMEAAGLFIPEEYIHHEAGGEPANGIAGLDYFLDSSEFPTAIICFNDMMAIGVLKGLQQAHIDVPERCSVTGFDNITFSAYTNPTLTTFDQPKRYLGEEAARLILGMLDINSGVVIPKSKCLTIKGRLLIRNSTGRPELKL
jgi:DNA-binding LacI/PurR family transcriptional regulator